MRLFVYICAIVLIVVSGDAAPIIWEMGTSARAVAVGGAFSAIADDESALFYNPAGLALLNKITLAAFYHRAFEVVHHIALTGAGRYWGVQLVQIDTGPIESTNEFGNPSGGITHYASQAGLVGVAVGIETLSLGVRGKFSSDSQEIYWGLDAGVLARVGIVRIGLVAENLLGSGALSLRLGTAWVMPVHPRLGLTIALELWNMLSRPEVHLGLEASINGVQIRVGYDGVAVITGAGVEWNSLRFDWASRLHPQLPVSTMITIAYLF
ncbi:MAG: hypothetical protein NZ930_06965 [Candidatus Bipolaricaulota bacterium]|nr:hypothetical protein [Candidatus Bipolaricaulota bacterium]MDW8030649.1 hypothetical protein [Candidatus Bipolaricaulota bacterium]